MGDSPSSITRSNDGLGNVVFRLVLGDVVIVVILVVVVVVVVVVAGSGVDSKYFFVLLMQSIR